jgi:hypothetical protein
MCPPVTFRRCATQTTWSLSVTSTFALKIACDELHDDPFNPVARAELVRPNTDEAPTADAAQLRVATSMWTIAVRERERSL